VLVAVAVAVAAAVAVLVAVDVAVAVVAPVEVEPELELVDDEVLEPELELVDDEVLEPLELEVEEEVLDELDEGAAGDEDLENAPPRAASATADNPTAANGPTEAVVELALVPSEPVVFAGSTSATAKTLVEVMIAAPATLAAKTTAIDFFKFITHFL